MLSDLRESGAIEQDADIVSFIYRAEYYQLDTLEDGSPSSGAAEIIVAKHRNGAVDSIKLGWNKNLAKFCNYDDLMGGGGGGMNFLNPGSFGNNAGGGYEDFESVQSKANNQSITPINDMPF
jgi:replicative DNA helicase